MSFPSAHMKLIQPSLLAALDSLAGPWLLARTLSPQPCLAVIR
jgi:hypothetical protein